MTSKEFPHLNNDTKQIFDEFTKIYSKGIEDGKEEVEKICAEYKQSQGQKLGKENLHQQQQIR